MTYAELTRRLLGEGVAEEVVHAGARAAHVEPPEYLDDPLLPKAMQPVEPCAYILTVAQEIWDVWGVN